MTAADGATAAVVVVGGGIAGLVIAWELARAGHRVAVLEAAATPGGAVSAHRVGGLVLDAGAESYATASPAVADLVLDLGLGADLVSPRAGGAWVRHASGTAPLPATAVLGIPGHPFARDVRRVIGLPGAARALADRLLPGRSLGGAGLTLGAAVGRRMGARVLDRLVGPVAGGVYGTPPDRLELAAIAPALLDAALAAGSLAGGVRATRPGGERPGSAVGGLAGGMHRIPSALVAAIEAAGGSVVAASRVTELRERNAGWTVHDDAGRTWTGDRVVLAVPGQSTAALLGPALPDATDMPAPTAEIRVCTLVVDDARLDAAPRGTGVLVAAGVPGLRATALTHSTAKWAWLADAAPPGRHVLRVSYGHATAAVTPDADLVPIALADAAALLDVPLRTANLIDAAVRRWPSTPAGPRQTVDRVRAAAEDRGVYLAGGTVAGTGLVAVVADARRVAARLLTATPREQAGHHAAQGWTA